jgi:hypothetical protein
MNTILLDISTWDYVVDAAGNWAMATEPYALAQDVSSAIRLVKGELWYDKTQGTDYFGSVFGKNPPLAVLQEYFVNAALTVPGVVSAVAIIQAFNPDTRQVTGQVQFKDSNGNTGTVMI